MTEIYNTTAETSTLSNRRYIVQQQTAGEDRWYGDQYCWTRLGAIWSAWFSGVASGGTYNFRVLRAKGQDHG